jgi:hypothetical protein
VKTILAFVVAFALGALLVYFLMSYLEPPPAPPPPLFSCEELIGPGPHGAAVLVMWDPHVNGCKLKTVPPGLPTCVGHELLWDAAPIGRCAGYFGTLEIQLKPGENPDDLDTTPGQGKAKGKVARRPAKCKPHGPCSLQYSVTLHPTEGSDPPLVEDPKIDIW